MKKRINFIDVARGLAIFLIVLRHTIVHSQNSFVINRFLCGFIVVVFFMLSGYTFKIKKDEKFVRFLKNKFLRIMIPYFIWALLFLIPYLIFGKNVGISIGTNSSFELKELIKNIFYGNGNLSALKQNSALWFLPALFSINILYYLIIKYFSKSEKTDTKVLLVTIAVGYISSHFLKIYLPWGINTALNIGFFFYIGYLIKKYNIFTKEKLFKLKYIIPIFILGLLACFFNSEDIACIEYSYGNFTLAIISSICLSITMIYISFLINKNSLLEYIGNNTMGILIFHKLIILIFQTKFGPVSSLLKSSNMFLELGIAILISIISILFSIIGTILTRKISPFLLGEK